MKAKTLLAATLLAAFGFGGSANAYIIDLFDDPAVAPWQVVVADATTPTAFNQYGAATTIIGSYRDLIVNFVSGGSTEDAKLAVSDGLLSFSTDAGAIGTGTVQWDGNDNSATLDRDGLGGLNLITQEGCTGGCDRFVAAVKFADLGFGYQISVYDMDGNYSTLSTQSLGAASPVEADYLFSWFKLDDGEEYLLNGLPFSISRSVGLVDFTRIGALELVLNPDGLSYGGAAIPQTISVDLQIDSITKTVPEPGSLALLGIGLLGAVLVGRRRTVGKA